MKPTEYNKKIQGTKNPITTIKKGIKKTVINNILTMGNTEIKKAKNELLEGITDHKQEMMKEENFKKIVNLIDYEIKGINTDGETIMKGYKHGITINQAKSEISESIAKDNELAKYKSDPIIYLKKKGWEAEKLGEGKIIKVTTTITLRKS